jgi:hypothetical protein
MARLKHLSCYKGIKTMKLTIQRMAANADFQAELLFPPPLSCPEP